MNDEWPIEAAGDDTFIWNPGDANDSVEGQDGFDTLQFNASLVHEWAHWLQHHGTAFGVFLGALRYSQREFLQPM